VLEWPSSSIRPTRIRGTPNCTPIGSGKGLVTWTGRYVPCTGGGSGPT
jgi:hypothetical protein